MQENRRKPLDLCRDHFIERLQERYDMFISQDEYYEIKGFQGLFNKIGSSDKTVGYVYIKGHKVWCLYSKHHKLPTTAYPPDVEYDINSAINACFGPALRPMAYRIYELYLKEKEIVPKEFNSEADAAKYYFKNTYFPSCHIENFKNKEFRVFRLMHKIRLIISCESNFVELTLSKK